MTDPVRNAEIDILRYLIAHEEARDTLEGIEKWWLPRSAEYGIADIAVALQRLEDSRLLRVWKPISAKPIYGRAADLRRLEEYIRMLESGP